MTAKSKLIPYDLYALEVDDQIEMPADRIAALDLDTRFRARTGKVWYEMARLSGDNSQVRLQRLDQTGNFLRSLDRYVLASRAMVVEVNQPTLDLLLYEDAKDEFACVQIGKPRRARLHPNQFDALYWLYVVDKYSEGDDKVLYNCDMSQATLDQLDLLGYIDGAVGGYVVTKAGKEVVEKIVSLDLIERCKYLTVERWHLLERIRTEKLDQGDLGMDETELLIDFDLIEDHPTDTAPFGYYVLTLAGHNALTWRKQIKG